MIKTRIAVLISGGGSNLQALIDEIHNKDVNGEIGLVISSKEGAYGLARGEKNGIEAKVINKKDFTSQLEYENALLKSLEKSEIDLIILAGYLSLVPSTIIKKYENRIINIHPSLIPSFCGKGFYGIKVHEEAINRGVKISGATVHFVNEGMDQGPIIIQRVVEVDFKDTAETLQQKILKIEHEILPLAVKLYIDEKLEVVNNKVKIN